MQDDQAEQLADDENAIAVVGMACHLPGANNLDEYWHNLRDGVESVRFYSDQELLEAGEDPQRLADPNYVRAQPELRGMDRFDAGFWGFNPQDAAVTDPAHRLFLEVAYQALEHAGHTGFDEEGTVGVFASSGASLYWMQNLITNPALIDQMGEFLVRHTGNDMNFLATRLSYELDLKGPSINVQTACSSSLVAIHNAIQSLLSDECDLALAGASTVLVPPVRGYLYRQGEIMSPDGHCRPFDAQSAGTIFGSGAGAVILRRLDDALAEGDRVLAVIRGSAINNDGAAKAGYLAPGVEGQAAVVAEALGIADVSAAQVSYVEAHGTGTLVGDPIEIEALKQVFAEDTQERQFCQVGSVKANIGHLGEAAGIASVIKAVLSLQHGQIPPVPNFKNPNPEMDIANSPFRIVTELRDWQPIDGRRICGVTSLGAGGTNAHLVLEGAPIAVESHTPEQGASQALLLSAKSEPALQAACMQLAAHLEANPDVNLRDVAYTLSLGRRSYQHRAALVAADSSSAVAVLRERKAEQLALRETAEQPHKLVFLLPGGGAQYAGMGADLYRTQPVYATHFDACMDCLTPELATTVRALVLAAPEQRAAATTELEQPSLSLPALFATEYALARLLEYWGAIPDALIGHSMGENTAACLAGVLSLADSMALVSKRGALFEKVAPGAMLSVSLSADALQPYLHDGLDIAALNAPELLVVSGPVAQVDALQAALGADEVQCTRIHIHVAAHSAMLEPILPEFEQFCRSLNFQLPQKPFTSNLTGTWITNEQATDPCYWVDHLRSTVRFADNVATVHAAESAVMVEIGPGRTLASLAKASGADAQRVFNSMRHPSDTASDDAVALQTLASLWASGGNIDWHAYWGDSNRQRLALPGYPFQRQRYWVEPGQRQEQAGSPVRMHKRGNMDDWFAIHSWARSGRPKPRAATTANWLLFADDDAMASSLVTNLAVSTGADSVIRVQRTSGEFAALDSNVFELDPAQPVQFEALFAALAERQADVEHLVYAWPAQLPLQATNVPVSISVYTESEPVLFWGLFNLAKQLCDLDQEVQLSVLARELFSPDGQPGQVNQATLIGPVMVLPHETANVRSRLIDLHPGAGSLAATTLMPALVAELQASSDERFVRLAPAQRWVRSLQQTYLPAAAAQQDWIRPGGTYVISGGLGGIGLTVARHLAHYGAARICLISRNGLPDRDQWAELPASADVQTIARVAAIAAIESAGAQVLILQADVADSVQLESSLREGLGSLAAVNGVFHAAGTMDDQLIMVKSEESARAVLSAKVRGALALDQLFAEQPLDFFVLFSSIASHLGLPGQIDYSAANAFLDALAHNRRQRSEGYSAVINWNAWRDVGMAAQAAGLNSTSNNGAGGLPPRSLLRATHAQSLPCFEDSFSVSQDWLLAEHRVRGGQALLSGTALLELFYQAYLQHQGAGELPAGQVIELSELTFVEAFQVSDAHAKPLNVAVQAIDDGHSLTLYSQDLNEPNATCVATLVSSAQPASLDLATLRADCPVTMPTSGRYLAQSFMNFGPRWGCIDHIGRSRREPKALLQLSLELALAADVSYHPLHPALMDMATGGAQFLIDEFRAGSDFYVPVRYQRIRVYAPLPVGICALVENTTDGAGPFATFDVTVTDNSGAVLLEIEGFTMKRVEQGSQMTANAGANTPPYTQLTLPDILQHAIAPLEGMEALDRIMHSQDQTQYVVSSVDTLPWLSALDMAMSQTDESSAQGLQFVHEDQHDPDAEPEIAAAEQALQVLDQVQEVVVRCFGNEAEGLRPVAFVATSADDLSLEALNQALNVAAVSMRLSALERLNALPRNADGALERTLCLDPLQSTEQYDAPQGATEEKLAGLWANLLGMPQVGRDDNFFELGGHSLLLTRLISRVQKAFERKLPLEEAYQNPTLSAWAQMLEASAKEPASAVKIGRVDRSKFKVP